MDVIETKTNPDDTTETMDDTKKAKGEAIEGGRVTDEAIATTTKPSSSSKSEEDDSNHHPIIENENENENPLDTKYYYYQNPTTGTVNSTPLSLRQLVKLFCPVREGMKPILPNHTQCLQFKQPQQQQQQQQSESESSTTSNTSEEWKVASDIDILKESSSSQWYISIPPSLNDVKDGDDTTGSCTTKGPMSCRGLFTEVQQQQQQQESKSSKSDCYDRIMVYETSISPEWTVISKIQNIQWVFKALNNEDMMQQQQQQLMQDDNMETPPNHQQDTNVKNDDDDQLLVASSDEQQRQQEIQDELEAFLSSTEVAVNTTSSSSSKQQQQKQQKLIDGHDEDEHTYESDGGTKYVKDPFSGNWIHEALAPNYDHNHSQTQQQHQQQADGNTNNTQQQPINNNNKKKKKKKNKAQFSKRNARNWIYVTGLPTTTQAGKNSKNENDEAEVNFDNVAKFFGKVGLLDLDPETLRPKIKLYYNKRTTTAGGNNNNNGLKGDASICYAHPQSVDLALQILDDSLWYDNKTKIKVERAKFEAKGGGAEEESGDGGRGGNADNTDGGSSNSKKRQQQHKRVPVSEAKRKVARLALKQAQDEGFGGRLAGGRKGLCIIVIKNMIEGIPENKLESEIYNTCEEFGTISKITVIESTKVVIVKFVEPTAASMAIEQLNSKTNPKTSKKLHVMYWDGVTDYTHNPEEEENLKKDEEKRHEEFGKWLEETQREELPEELRLRVE